MTHLTNERRQRERITLRCPLEIFVAGEREVRHATTLNVSSCGVYFLSPTSFSTGQRPRCRIQITPRCYRSGSEAADLNCVLEVVRVERMEDAYGIGCRIVHYLLSRQRGRERASRASN